MEMRVHVNQRYDAGKWRGRREGREGHGGERGEGEEREGQTSVHCFGSGVTTK
jgi:hypothetical protein